MNLIKITRLTKRRVKDMIVDLMPEYGYIRVTNRGLVILKTNWWSFRKTIINITDLFIDVLPKKLADSCKRKGYGDTYERMFSEDLYVMMQLKSYKKDIDIVEYIWEKFNRLHREVPIVTTLVKELYLESSSSLYLPVLSPTSSYYLPEIEILLKKRKKKGTVEEIIEKISKIQIQGPQWLMRVPVLNFA